MPTPALEAVVQAGFEVDGVIGVGALFEIARGLLRRAVEKGKSARYVYKRLSLCATNAYVLLFCIVYTRCFDFHAVLIKSCKMARICPRCRRITANGGSASLPEFCTECYRWNDACLKRASWWMSNHKPNNSQHESLFTTVEDVAWFFYQRCFYCGKAPTLRSLSGLDRVSCVFPYSKGTVVSCCTRCNYAKGQSDPRLFCRQIAAVVHYRRWRFYNGDDDRYVVGIYIYVICMHLYDRPISHKSRFSTLCAAKYHSASEIGRGFSISDSSFMKRMLKRCCYCGRLGARGIDRRDPRKGYTRKNSYPCCWSCNKMKVSYADNDDDACVDKN
eukprot:GHVU01079343.1.p1 GENE.GHVU01079343.1~~GHVU01079343.1.p1  ORF type:complete len:331 (-),score=-7.94 GHVU01079343.1:1488-2480(-)